METKSFFRNGLKCASFIMIFLWASMNVMAQCPTISDPAPPAICDASGFTIDDLDAFATDTGDGIVWYNSASGGAPLIGTQLVLEGTYYADNSSGTCTSRASVNINFQVDATGQNLDGIYCSNENPTVQTYIDNVLQANIPSGGSVEVYTDSDLTNLALGTDPIPLGGTNYFLIFIDGACKSQIEIGSTAILPAPADPTPNNPQMFCSDTNPTIANLDSGTTASFSWYQNVDVSGDPIPPALSSSQILVNGNTYYVQINDIFCDSNAIPVTVSIDVPNDPGTSASLEYCMDSVPSGNFNLFDELGGTPDTTGNWTGPLTTSNGHLGTVDISTLTTPATYTFTYNVPANGTCPERNSSVNITIYDIFSSGTASVNNPVSFCEASLPASFNLFTLIENYDSDGQWTEGTTSSGAIVVNPTNLDVTGYAPATYNFTYSQNIVPNPCLEESTTVQVIVLPDPNAGIAINQFFCENELATNSPFNLFDALDGSQDNNSGTWTDSSNATISNSIDMTAFTVAGSPYSFDYTIDNGICFDIETITITIAPAPESGNALAPIEICEEGTAANSPFNLFTLLDGSQDTNGTWYAGVDTSGMVVTNPITLSGFADGTYNYTYSVPDIGTCSDIDVTVQIIINPQPETGMPTAAVFCENNVAANSPLDLHNQLAGESNGGTWTDDNATGALSGSNVDITLLAIGSYNFTYSITDANGCSNNSTVVVTIEDAPESGTVNTPVSFCVASINTGETYNLYDLLTGEDQTGSWTDDDASGALSGNLVTIDGLPTGTYNFTYDVDAIDTCDDVNVTVSFIINDTPAPAASATQLFCDTALISDLSATGTNIIWYDAATGGNALPETNALADGQIYYASQTDTATSCESSMRTAVSVTIYQSPNAGNINTSPIVVCNDNLNIDLNTGLDGTQDSGGVWQNDDGVGVLVGNSFNATGLSVGTYNFTYLVNASAPCAHDSTTITITIEEPLNAGTDGTPIDVCSNNGTVDLFTQLGGTPQTGGIWSPALASNTGVFDPLVDIPGTYTYTLTNACGTASSEVVISVTLAPNAGLDNSVLICVGDGVTDLFALLGTSAQSGGVWSPALPSGTGTFDPTSDSAGIYTYTVSAVSPCTTDAVAQITVTVDDTPIPMVSNTSPEFCRVNNPTVSNLDSVITSAGTNIWYEDAALTITVNPTDDLVDGEDYYLTQTNSSGCESSQSTVVSVTINDTPTPTLANSNLELCINDNPTLHELELNIVEFNSSSGNMAWYDDETGGASISSNTSLINGTTYYAALIDVTTGCESSVRLPITPDLTSCGKLVLPDGFSPNGDGVNDTYDIDNLQIIYPNFEIEIYNRYGNIVYKGTAATPRFDGTSNQSKTVADGDLPVGVYFYIFKFNDGENKPKQGRLYLSR